MDVLEVKALLERGNSVDTAFMPERVEEIALAETLSALANAQGGVVLLGVTPAGAIRGVRDADVQVEKALSAALLTIPPLVLPMPEPVQVEDQTVVAVQVPAGLPNVYALDRRYLIRDKAGNRSLGAAEIHSLLAQRGVVHLETQIPPGARLEDLDWDLVRQYVNRFRGLQDLDAQEILRRRGCLVELEGALWPTYAGLLLFGHTPTQWVKNAEVTAVRYPGSEMGDAFVREDITGTLSDQIRKTEAFLRTNTMQQVVLDGLARQEQALYPEDVLREVIVNAVAHRDYTLQGESTHLFVFSDRVEVYSPGRLPGHVTVENIVEERFSRNPVIVQVLADMGFIERLGYGIDRMLRLLEEAGHPAPRFAEKTAGFQVTLYTRVPQVPAGVKRWTDLDLNPRQEQALDYVIEHDRITNRELQELCPDVSTETIRRDLSDLVDKDLLLRIGSKRATYYILKDARLAAR